MCYSGVRGSRRSSHVEVGSPRRHGYYKMNSINYLCQMLKCMARVFIGIFCIAPNNPHSTYLPKILHSYCHGNFSILIAQHQCRKQQYRCGSKHPKRSSLSLIVHLRTLYECVSKTRAFNCSTSINDASLTHQRIDKKDGAKRLTTPFLP